MADEQVESQADKPNEQVEEPVVNDNPQRVFHMQGHTYDVLKWFALILFPALITLYGVVAATWSLPYTTQILTTLNGLEVCLGSILGVSHASYNKSQGI